ncbi:MAG: signal peptidase I [Candidatus Lokiarchaeota archaeon]|nr:signal peptidase I [Candidatus Lokiarchaeota archaeon]
MKRKNIKAPVKQEKEASLKRKIIVTVILLGLAFSGAFLIYYIMQIALNTDSPMVVVVSGSMEPKLHRGDLLFLKGKDAENIKNGTIEGKEGDIIVFDARGLWITAPSDPIVHRVVDKKYDNGWFFLTKGDANTSPDAEWVPEPRILGVVVGRIPYIGWVKIALTDSGLLIPLLVIVSLLLVISIVWDLFNKEEETDSEIKKKIYNEENIEKEIELDYTNNN